MKRLLFLFLLFPFISYADNTAYVQNIINSSSTLPTATYTVTQLTITHSFNAHNSTFNCTGTGASIVMNVAGTSFTSATVNGTTPVYNATTQYGIAMSAANLTVDHVNVSNMPTYGIVGGSFNNQVITNSTVFNTGFIGISLIANSGTVTGIVVANNVINRGPQGVNVLESCLIVRGQTGGVIQGALIHDNIITQAANPISGRAECFEIRGCTNCQIYNNSFTGGTIGTSIVIGCIGVRNHNNTYQNQSQIAIEMGDITQCSSYNITITSGKVGVLFDGIASTTVDSLYSSSISGCTSFPVQVSSAFVNGIYTKSVTVSTVTNAIYILKGQNIAMDSWVATGNNTSDAIFLDTSPGIVTVSNSSFTGFTPKLFYFYKGASPSLTVNNVIANNVTISPGTVCYANSANITVGANVQCVTLPAVPLIKYAPNSFSFLINSPITPINITSSGGAVSSYSINIGQPPGLLFSTSSAQFTGIPLALSPLTNYIVTGNNISGSDTANIKIAIIDRAPVISYAPSSQVCTINVAMTPMTPISSSGSVVSYTVSPALPASISLNPVTGVISGTGLSLLSPTVFTIFAFNSGGSTSFLVTLSIVNPAPVAPSISFSPNTYNLPINVVAPIISPINVGGTASSWAISTSLPTNLTFSTSTGQVTGTPNTLLSLTAFDVSATNITGTSHATLNLSVVSTPPPAPNLSFTPNSVTLVQNQSSISVSPSNSGGAVAPPYTILPSLSPGLLFDSSTATIYGIPSTTSSAVTYQVTGSNVSGNSSAPITITIVPSNPAPTILVRGHVAILVF